MSCFDGFIVARNKETGKLQAKDLDKHIERLNAASKHLDLSIFDAAELKKLISELLKIENRWVSEDGAN
jgi:branched-subunit amino acid aminotransferase/4-amino-4-deoxychorismate lyase